MIKASPFMLNGNKILITGASSGIGAAVAKMASTHGAVCILNGRDKTKLEETLKNMVGTEHLIVPAALSENSGGSLVKQIVSEIGPLNGFVHCAGIEKTLPFRSTELSDLREIMQINLEAFWEITQELLRAKNHEKENLSVVGISSAAGLYGAAGKSAYASSKGALVSLIKSLAAEYSNKKIRFNCVSPGYVDTPMLEAVRKLYKTKEEFESAIASKHLLGLGKPEDVANAAVYLLSDASRWITGSILEVDGGYGVR